MTDPAPAFPTGPYRIRSTATGVGLGGRPSTDPLMALIVLRRWMRRAPELDPVVIDAAGRPVSVKTLFRASLVSEAEATVVVR